MRTQITLLTILTALCLVLGTDTSRACERPLTLKGKGGMELPGMLAIPCGLENDQVKHAVILVHGSGPSNMDGDLTAVTRDNKKNLLLKDVSDVLIKEGFAVIRYDKRSYIWQTKIQKDPKLATDPSLPDFQKNAYAYLIADVKQAVAWSKKNLKNARVSLLGQSQGTYIALQVAHQNPDITGVALWGFYATSLGALAYSQIVHRTLAQLKRLDVNSDGLWSAGELSKGPPNVAGIAGLLGKIDRDGDKNLSHPELQSFLLGSAISMGLVGSLEKQEAPYPTAVNILRAATFKTAFFHGTWDNQTPVFHTWAVETMLKKTKDKASLHFRYFPKLGHGLDPRQNALDVLFQPSDTAALKTLAQDLKAFL